MKKSRSVLTVSGEELKPKDETGRYSRSYTSSSTLGSDLRRGRRRPSSTLQVPPWRPGERARSPDYDSMQRPTTLPLRIPPRISITHADSDSDKSFLKHVSCGRWIYA
ncbi:3',5'-cyclic-AMP phosphodiesterase 4B-like [Hyperolius riggenbachi]|uniref:3',5'-cyclic-AMP phosphodiesterase 4B-like n=1 Tax=Hyperolius riggenbachi TaxID=752182 RepID=UPI0035A3B8C9